MELHGVWLRLLRAAPALCAVLSWCGCGSVALNKPVPLTVGATPADGSLATAGKLAVCTVFADGSQAVHLKRRAEIGQVFCRHLESAGSRCEPVDEFDVLEKRARYSHIIRLYCEAPRHETRRNKAAFVLLWPATVSILASPIGLIGLSFRGLIKESAEFRWRVALYGNQNLCRPRWEKEIEPLTARVSATGWGVNEDVLLESYRNADSAMIAQAVAALATVDCASLPVQPPEPGWWGGGAGGGNADDDDKPPTRAAVWEVRALEGADPSACSPVTEALRTQLAKCRRFTVMARDEMKRVFNEQEGSMSAGCDSTDCAVEYGQALSVERIVVGSISKVGTDYQLVVKVVNVNDQRIETAASVHRAGGAEVLLDLAREAASQVCGQ